jgi:hypothetical protein
MKPTTVNLTILRDYIKGFQWIDKATNQPRDLTGCTFKMQVRAEKSFPASPVLAEFSSANGKITCATPLVGKWFLDLSKPETFALEFEKAVYDIDITFPSGDVLTPVEGTFDPILKVTL